MNEIQHADESELGPIFRNNFTIMPVGRLSNILDNLLSARDSANWLFHKLEDTRYTPSDGEVAEVQRQVHNLFQASRAQDDLRELFNKVHNHTDESSLD